MASSLAEPDSCSMETRIPFMSHPCSEWGFSTCDCQNVEGNWGSEGNVSSFQSPFSSAGKCLPGKPLESTRRPQSNCTNKNSFLPSNTLIIKKRIFSSVTPQAWEELIKPMLVRTAQLMFPLTAAPNFTSCLPWKFSFGHNRFGGCQSIFTFSVFCHV